jgi:hypothetical protein
MWNHDLDDADALPGDAWPQCYAPLRCAKVCPVVAFGRQCMGSVEFAALGAEPCVAPEDSELGIAALVV